MIMPDGAPLVSDDKAAAIYRISYKFAAAEKNNLKKQPAFQESGRFVAGPFDLFSFS